jgi:hypothetical protein
LLVYFGDILTLRASGVSAPTYAWLKPLLDAYRSPAIEFRYVRSLSLSATSAGFGTDLRLPEMHVSTDGYQLNATLTSGLAFAGAIYIDKNRWVRMIVRSYDNNTGVPNTLDAYLDTAACPAGWITAACYDTLFAPRNDQEWRDGNRAIPSMMVRPVPVPTRAPAPTPQRTPTPTAPRVRTNHMMVEFNGGLRPAGYYWLGPLILYLSQQQVKLAPFRYEPHLSPWIAPPNMPTTTDGYFLRYNVVNFPYSGTTVNLVYAGFIYIDTNGLIRMAVRAYHARDASFASPLHALDATLECAARKTEACIPIDANPSTPRPQNWRESSPPNNQLPFIRVHGLAM